jgi:hypothetical protein
MDHIGYDDVVCMIRDKLQSDDVIEFEKLITGKYKVNANDRCCRERECVLWMAHETMTTYGLLCRIFLSDDPKAEFTKTFINDISVFLSPPRFETDDEFRAYYKKVADKHSEVFHRYLSDIYAFLATVQDSIPNQTD